MSRLDAIEARDQAATEGPWFEGIAGQPGVVTYNGEDVRSIAIGVSWPDNRAFIAHARADLPWTVGLVRRLEGHAGHKPGCPSLAHGDNRGPCSPDPAICGLDALMAEVRG